MPRPGEVLHVGRAASVQFAVPIIVRVKRVLEFASTPHGWIWLDVYQVDTHGTATDERQIMVQPAGLRRYEPVCICEPSEVRIPHRMECPRYTLGYRDGRVGSINDRARQTQVRRQGGNQLPVPAQRNPDRAAAARRNR
jgi:hypothetical protein